MKKVISILIAALLVLSCVSAFAADDITVVVDGQTIAFDQPPIIENGRTLVPMRAIFEALGCDVDYTEGEDGGQYVYAQKGLTNISLIIGSTDMYVNNDTITLDVPAKIENSRTLVPVRAISEALGAAVDWNGNTKTVTVEGKRGLHRCVTERINDTQIGKYTLNATAKYPVLYAETDCPILAAINAETKKAAEEYMKNARDTYQAQDADADVPEEMRTLTYNMDCEVTIDRNNLLSIVEYYYEYTGGAHPNSFMVGRTYDLTDGHKIGLSDILNTDAVSLDAIITDGLTKYFEGAEDQEFVQGVIAEGIKNKDNAGFYLTDNSLVIFYNPYEIAPYASGYPTIEVPYSPETFKVSLAAYDLPELDIALEGNITTAYEWIQADENDKLTVTREYLAPDTELLGAPGTFLFKIKGAKPGYTELKLRYRRPYETNSLKTAIYRIRVEKDLGITVCESEMKDY